MKKSIKNKIRNLACGAAFALSQAGTALAAEDEKSGFTISGTFDKVIKDISPVMKEGLEYAFDNVSSLAWGAIVAGIVILIAKAGLSQLNTESSPGEAAKQEGAIVALLRVLGVGIFAAGIVAMAYIKFA